MITNSIDCPSIELNLIWNEKIFMIQQAVNLNPFLNNFMWINLCWNMRFSNNPPPSIYIYIYINVLNKLPKDKFIYSSTFILI